ncbi:hypothetical protein HY572_02055 [Candidatus Micrarchaeota archaeon]|nr:hypothetical protein [Candidatus Micrarchaeota archaeon]
MRKIELSKEWLEGQYLQGKSLREIARETGHDPKTIIKEMRRNRVQTRTVKESWKYRKTRSFNGEKFQQQYYELGWSLGKIANYSKTSRHTVRRWAKKLGFRIRNLSESMKGIKRTPAQRRRMSEARIEMLKRRPDLVENIRIHRLGQILPRETSIERMIGEELSRREIGYYKQMPILRTC